MQGQGGECGLRLSPDSAGSTALLDNPATMPDPAGQDGRNVASARGIAPPDGDAFRTDKIEQLTLSWRVLSDEAAAPGLTGQWSRLADRCDGSLFVNPEWVNTWRATIAPEIRPCVVVGTDARGRLGAIWPLGIRSVGHGLAQQRILEPMGGSVASGDRLDPVMALPQLQSELVAEARKAAGGDADLIHWSELRH